MLHPLAVIIIFLVARCAERDEPLLLSRREPVHRLRRRIDYLLHRRRYDRELQEEMAFHRADLARRSGEGRSARHSPGDGRFGNTLLAREDARAVWLARHWSVDEMLDTWASCAAEGLAGYERVKPPWTMADMAYLWVHAYGGRPPGDMRTPGTGRNSR